MFQLYGEYRNWLLSSAAFAFPKMITPPFCHPCCRYMSMVLHFLIYLGQRTLLEMPSAWYACQEGKTAPSCRANGVARQQKLCFAGGWSRPIRRGVPDLTRRTCRVEGWP